MKCRRTGQMLSPYLTSELSASEARALESHLDTCPRCHAEMKAMRKALTALQSPVRQFEPPDILELIKLKAMENPRRPFVVRRSLAWAAAAALVVIVVLAGAAAKHSPGRPSAAWKPETPVTTTPRHLPAALKVAAGGSTKTPVAGPGAVAIASVGSETHSRRSGNTKIRRQRPKIRLAVQPTSETQHDSEPLNRQIAVEATISDEPVNGTGEVYVRENGRLYRAMSYTGPDGEIRTVPIRRLPFYDQPRRQIDLGDYAVRVARGNGAGTDYVREVR